MIGLTVRQAKLYAAMVDAFKGQRRSLSRADIAIASGIKLSSLDEAIAPLIRRKFVGANKAGRFVPWAPPHETICVAVCEELSISLDDVRGRSKLPKMVRARRIITKRLRLEYHYTSAAVAQVINRHQSTAEEYLYRERALNRSKRRVERFRAQKEREMRLAA